MNAERNDRSQHQTEADSLCIDPQRAGAESATVAEGAHHPAQSSIEAYCNQRMRAAVLELEQIIREDYAKQVGIHADYFRSV